MNATKDASLARPHLLGPRSLTASMLVVAALASACGESSAGSGPEDSGNEMDAGHEDAEVNPTRIVTTAVGTLDESGAAVNDIAYGTFVSTLLSGIVPSEGTTVVAVDAETAPVQSPETTPLEPGMSLRLTGPQAQTRTYALGFEALLNETVVLVDGTPIRFETRFFTNSAAEYIIVNKAAGGGGTHYCIHSDVVTGTYGPQDESGVGICLELFNPSGTNIQASGYTNFGDFDFVFDITVTETSMSGRYRGFVRRGGDGVLLPVLGFMHSDRVESGGWGGN